MDVEGPEIGRLALTLGPAEVTALDDLRGKTTRPAYLRELIARLIEGSSSRRDQLLRVHPPRLPQHGKRRVDVRMAAGVRDALSAWCGAEIREGDAVRRAVHLLAGGRSEGDCHAQQAARRSNGLPTPPRDRPRTGLAAGRRDHTSRRVTSHEGVDTGAVPPARPAGLRSRVTPAPTRSSRRTRRKSKPRKTQLDLHLDRLDEIRRRVHARRRLGSDGRPAAPRAVHGPASEKVTRRLQRALCGERDMEFYVAPELSYEQDLEIARWFAGLPAGSKLRVLLGARLGEDGDVDMVGLDDPEDVAREVAATATHIGRPGAYSARACWIPGVDGKLYGLVLLTARLDRL